MESQGPHILFPYELASGLLNIANSLSQSSPQKAC